MSDHHSNQPNSRETLEVRIVAYLLGELSEEQRREVEDAIAQNPGLAKFRDEMADAIGLAREAHVPAFANESPDTPTGLDPERRMKVIEAWSGGGKSSGDTPNRFTQTIVEFNRRLLPYAAVLVLGLCLATLFIGTNNLVMFKMETPAEPQFEPPPPLSPEEKFLQQYGSDQSNRDGATSFHYREPEKPSTSKPRQQRVQYSPDTYSASPQQPRPMPASAPAASNEALQAQLQQKDEELRRLKQEIVSVQSEVPALNPREQESEFYFRRVFMGSKNDRNTSTNNFESEYVFRGGKRYSGSGEGIQPGLESTQPEFERDTYVGYIGSYDNDSEAEFQESDTYLGYGQSVDDVFVAAEEAPAQSETNSLFQNESIVTPGGAVNRRLHASGGNPFSTEPVSPPVAARAKTVPSRSAPEPSPNDKLKLLSDALRARDAGDYEAAAQALDTLAQHTPDDPMVKSMKQDVERQLIEQDRAPTTELHESLLTTSATAGSGTTISSSKPLNSKSYNDGLGLGGSSAKETTASSSARPKDNPFSSLFGGFGEPKPSPRPRADLVEGTSYQADSAPEEFFQRAGVNVPPSPSKPATQNSKETEKKLTIGRSQLLFGDLRGAQQTIQETLATDPDNTEAQALLAEVERMSEEAGDWNRYHTRAQMLEEVNRAWQRPAVFASESNTDKGGYQSELLGQLVAAKKREHHAWENEDMSYMAASASYASEPMDKLRTIKIPNVSFNQMPLSRVIETLSVLTQEYDLNSPEEEKGVNFVMMDTEKEDPEVTITLRNFSADKIVEFVTKSVGYRYDVYDGAIVVRPSDAPAFVETRFYPLDPLSANHLLELQSDERQNWSPSYLSSGLAEKVEIAAKNFLEQAGVPFEEGDHLAYDGQDLIITQSLDNQEKVSAILRHIADVADRKQRLLEEYGEDAETPEEDAIEPEPEPPAPPQEYPEVEFNTEVSAAENPFSTFSLNVSDVSFKLAVASLEQGKLPHPSSIRTEEFVNAMDYRLPAPAQDQPIAVDWELARDPFAHNRSLLRFSVKTAATGRTAGQPLNLVLLLDNSGSMERPDRVEIIQHAVGVLTEKLSGRDRISLISFARTPTLHYEKDGQNASRLQGIVSRLVPQGGTNLEAALDLAYQVAQRNHTEGANSRVILLTDGAANLGDFKPEHLKQLIVEKRKQGIAFDGYGIGWDGYNDALMEEITRNGDGRYGFLNNPDTVEEEFADKLAGTLNVAAENVKVQVEFNPSRVTLYRQIGYDKHRLKKEDFRDNTVDAAEIAAEESGTALYTVKLNEDAQATGPIGTLRIRYRDPATGLYEEQEVLLPYLPPVSNLADARPATRLSTVAARFAERLADNPHASTISYGDLLNLLNTVAKDYGHSPDYQRLKTMIQTATRLD